MNAANQIQSSTISTFHNARSGHFRYRLVLSFSLRAPCYSVINLLIYSFINNLFVLCLLKYTNFINLCGYALSPSYRCDPHSLCSTSYTGYTSILSFFWFLVAFSFQFTVLLLLLTCQYFERRLFFMFLFLLEFYCCCCFAFLINFFNSSVLNSARSLLSLQWLS